MEAKLDKAMVSFEVSDTGTFVIESYAEDAEVAIRKVMKAREEILTVLKSERDSKKEDK